MNIIFETVIDTRTKTCPKCGEEKPLDQFGIWGAYMGKRQGQPRTYCRSCEKDNSKAAYKRRVESRPPKIKEKSLGWVTTPSGQVVELIQTSGGYQLRESRD